MWQILNKSVFQLKTMKTGKVVGPDGTPVEVWDCPIRGSGTCVRAVGHWRGVMVEVGLPSCCRSERQTAVDSGIGR